MIFYIWNEKSFFFFFSGALRFCRKIVGLKEDFYNRYIMNENLFRPIVDAFLANGDRYNLINSAMIELFEFITSVSDNTYDDLSDKMKWVASQVT